MSGIILASINSSKNINIRNLKFIYIPKKNTNKVRIFSKSFVKKYKRKFKIVYKNKISDLEEYFEDIDKNYNHLDKIVFKLQIIDNIINMNFMFEGWNELFSIT